MLHPTGLWKDLFELLLSHGVDPPFMCKKYRAGACRALVESEDHVAPNELFSNGRGNPTYAPRSLMSRHIGGIGGGLSHDRGDFRAGVGQFITEFAEGGLDFSGVILSIGNDRLDRFDPAHGQI